MKKMNPAILFLSILFFSLTTSPVFAETTEGCGMFDLRLGCDLSGWMKLILGDLAIGAVLALLLHYLSHRSNIKIEENSRIGKENSKQIEKIIVAQEDSRHRRKIYVIQTLKNHLGSILLCIGFVNKFLVESTDKDLDEKRLSNLIEQEKELKHLLQRSRVTLSLAIDIFDPLLIDQIEKFLDNMDLMDFSKFHAIEISDYEKFKDKILKITERLNGFLDPDVVLK